MGCKNCGMRLKPTSSGRKRDFCSKRCRQALHVRHKRHLVRELARNEWHSPIEIVEAARAVMGGIDLDPASCTQANEIVKAERFYSVRDDGLKQEWFGRIWLNPPYGRFAPRFVTRFGELFEAGSIEQGILLLGTHHLTTRWVGSLLLKMPIVCFPVKRLHFSDSTVRPAHGSVILGFGVDHRAFNQRFSQFGYSFQSYEQTPSPEHRAPD